MDMIDLMPPGLYEAVITGIDETVENPELVQGSYLFGSRPAHWMTFARSGGNSAEDDSLSPRPPGFRRSPRACTAV